MSNVQKCFKYGYTHNVLKNIYNNTNKYCYTHKLVILKEIKEKMKNEKQKEKLEIKQKKLEEKNKLKEELKEKKLQEKLKNNIKNAKVAKNDFHLGDENVVIGSNNINNESCIQILKTGKNIGSQCGSKSYNNCLCKRHYNMENKIK